MTVLREKDEPFSKKEILTADGIRADLTVEKIPPNLWVVAISVGLLLAGIGIFGLSFAGGWETIPLWGLVALGVLFPLILLLHYVNLVKKSKKRISGRLILVRDLLRHTDRGSPYPVWNYSYSVVERLYFAHYGRFTLNRRFFYEWSRENRMTTAEIIETSHPGDLFYIVISADDRKKRPLMFYNTRIFDCPDFPEDASEAVLDPGRQFS